VRRVPVLICLLAVASACATPAGAQASGRSRADVQRLEDEGVREIIVARDPGLSAAARDDLRAGAGVTHVANVPLPDTEVVRAPAGGLVEAVDALDAEPGVRYAEPNGIVRAASSDPLFAQLWGLENTGQDIGVAPNTVKGTVDADIDAPEAWAQSTGAGQVVAVVDSGMDATHEDLAGAQWTNPGEVSNGVDDDRDGAIDDLHGWNALTTTTDVTDTNGHGTHVTGTLAARKDNALGVAGVAPSAQVFPLVALDSLGIGSDASVASAFDVAGNLGIAIVNASVEAPFSVTVQAAVNRHPNTLYVLAAGNDSANDDTTSSLCQIPAANVICVGASDANDGLASFSNVGQTSVDLFAPGVNIASTYIPPTCAAPHCYAFLDGTSMAAPHVSGTLALMRARNPALTAAQLKATLLATVDPKGAFAAASVSGGRLNAAGAAAASPPAAAATTPAAGASTTTVATANATTAATAAVTSSAAAAAAPPVVASVGVAPVLGRPSIGAGALTARHPLTIRFTLDRAATVKLTILRGTKTVATTTIHGRKGTNRYVLRAKVGGRKLARGRYRVRLHAQGAARAATLAVTVR
jgi:subtilisin family serine protease